MHVNGIDPGFANDVLPLVMTSLSQRIDEVRVMEICDYSTYYQPVVMGDMFGFGRPMDESRPDLRSPGILTMAWGSVVRQIAAGLDIILDEPLTEEVDRRAAECDTDSVSGDVKAGTMGAVRFQVVGKVDGVPRVVLEHVTRTHPDQMPEWQKPPEGGGRLLPDQDHRRADDERRLHPPRRARRPQRLRHDHHRPADRQRPPRRRRRRARASSAPSTSRWSPAEGW